MKVSAIFKFALGMVWLVPAFFVYIISFGVSMCVCAAADAWVEFKHRWRKP